MLNNLMTVRNMCKTQTLHVHLAVAKPHAHTSPADCFGVKFHLGACHAKAILPVLMPHGSQCFNTEMHSWQVDEKYTRMQILCMHRQRWRKDLTAIQKKPATFARLLGVSHRRVPPDSMMSCCQLLHRLSCQTCPSRSCLASGNFAALLMISLKYKLNSTSLALVYKLLRPRPYPMFPVWSSALKTFLSVNATCKLE